MKKQNPKGIEIYVSQKRDILFIPVLHTKPGFGKSIGYFQSLDWPYGYADIGNIFFRVMDDMKYEPILDGTENITPAFKIITKGKGFLTFQKGRQMIYASFEEGIFLQYWYRKRQGFGIDAGDKIIQSRLPYQCTAEEIGQAIDDIYYSINQQHLIGET